MLKNLRLYKMVFRYFCISRLELKMTYQHHFKVSDNSLVITLPNGFENKQVLVTVTDAEGIESDKIALMKLAANDPLYLADLKEVNDDFEGIEQETL
jgi:hypothetical protein